MKKTLIKIFSVFACLSVLAGVFVSCSEKEEEGISSYVKPFGKNQADPWVYFHPVDQNYYYTATDSGFGKLFVKKAKSIDGLRTASTHTIGTANSGWLSGAYSYIWAPELHYIYGEWYMFFTASISSSGSFQVKNYVAKCTSQDPTDSSAWTLLGRMRANVESTFSDSNTNVILSGGDWVMSLDGTVFEVNGQWYYAWAQNCYDGGWADEVAGDGMLTVGGCDYVNLIGGTSWSCIVIGKTSPEDFTKVTDAHVISVPSYGWECQLENYDYNGAFYTSSQTNKVNVDEGPAILHRNGRVFLVFSASGCDESYCLGMLTADENADLTKIENWTKSEEPVFCTSVRNSVYGPGHCSFTKDGDYDVMVYHARNYPGLYKTSNITSSTTDALSDGHRSARAKVFTWNADGTPNFGEAE